MIFFDKMQAVGNDFIVVDEMGVFGRNLNELAAALCERRFSIGSDGLLVLGKTDNPKRLKFRMFNPDGTEDMCGNGMRCAVLWAAARGLVRAGDSIVLQGFDKDRTARLESVAGDLKSALVTVDMGAPDFSKAAIPFTGPVDSDEVLEYELPLPGEKIVISAVSTGSAHAVSFLNSPLSERDFARLSPLIERHPYFPEYTSIMWTVKEAESSFRIRIWERGASETLGCGTGAAAVAAVAWKLGAVSKNRAVEVISKGGVLRFSRDETGAALMSGPAELLFSGKTALPRKKH